MKDYLKLRTFIVLGVIAVFACAIHPLKPLDFYETFRSVLKSPEAALHAEPVISAARNAQSKRADLYPAAALLEAADKQRIELKRLTVFSDAFDNSEVVSLVRKKASSSIRLGLDLNGGVEFVLDLKPDYDALAAGGVSRAEAEQKLKANFREYRDLAMEALRKRLESQNIFESEIAPFGASALSLKAPIVSRDEKDKLQKLIQMSNKLEFRLVHPDSDMIVRQNQPVPLGYERLREVSKDRDGGNIYIVQRRPQMTGNAIDESMVTQTQFGSIAIALKFNRQGSKQFAEVTARNVQRQLAIVLDGKLYCAPVIQSRINGGQAEITGRFSMEEAQDIADALNSGSFPFRVDVQAVYDTDPTLGADNVSNGIKAGLAALVLLGIFMIVYYRTAGVIAVAALVANVVLILGAMAAFGATMTMPGIAGIILTLGMAVDANVLVFERMREEFEQGNPPMLVVRNGFKQAYSAVLDGNLTTLVVALILVYFGTGAVKGFAISLAIGIAASLFTALFMSRVLFDWLLVLKPDVKLSMLRFFSSGNIPFLRSSRIAVPLSLILIVLSLVLFGVKGREMLSVDFTGGTLLSYSYNKSVPVAELEKSLSEKLKLPAKVTYKSSASASDNRKVEILLREGFDRQLAVGSGGIGEYVRNGLNSQYRDLELNGAAATQIGALVGQAMTRNAMISLLLAFLGMIVYVSLRYEFNYAMAGILALVHDVILSLGVFVLMGRELSLPVAAGLLTIIGYSINDTIVIFDRIREEQHLTPDKPFDRIVDESLNRTLSRTILTSLTTFLVVAVMLIAGGIAISDFMLVIALGIIIGSYSSLYIASPIIVYYNKLKKKSLPEPEAECAAGMGEEKS